MINKKNGGKRKIMFFLANICLIICFFLNFFNKKLMPLFIKYGENQCVNISTRLINNVVANQIRKELLNEIVVVNNDETVSIDFNTAVLNSIANNTIKKIQFYFYAFEKGTLDNEITKELGLENILSKNGVVYKISISRAFENPLIGNLGIEIPISYRFNSDVKTQIVSSLKEYGINNALLEISLKINTHCYISVPMLSEEASIEVITPIVVKLIQGEIPKYFFGETMLGEV